MSPTQRSASLVPLPLLRRASAAVAVALIVIASAISPAGAQYGGNLDIQVFVDPSRVPTDATFSVFGRDCVAGATIEITIDGIPGVLATGVANASGFYSIEGIPLPDGLMAGVDYVVRATCGNESGTALITLICPSGHDPVNGSCSDGSDGTSGGVPATTSIPTAGGGGETPGGQPGLAFTGASLTGLTMQIGVTLLAGGFLLVGWATRRREDDAAGA